MNAQLARVSVAAASPRNLLSSFRRSRRRTAGRTLWIGIGLVLLVLVASAIGHFVLPNPNTQDLNATLAAPSLDHPFGTDQLGRDVLSRTLAATWLDLGLAVGVTFASFAIGLLVGAFAGYLGGWAERLAMRLVDIAIAFPEMILVLAIVAVLGPGVTSLVIAFVATGWSFQARFARAEMLVLRERQFVQAAQTLGFSRRRVILRHATPNLLRPLVVHSMSAVVLTVLGIATLTFLGLGVPPPTPEWGAIIASGQSYMLTAWWISTLPGLVVVIVGFGFVMIGDALSERLGARQEALFI